MERVNLRKGEKINLTKRSPISKLVVGLGWAVDAGRGANFDLDASAFLLGENGKVANNYDFVYYNNRFHASGAVNHMGDNLTGSTGDSDDEQIEVNLAKVPANISKILFIVTIFDAKSRKQNFGQISNAFIRIFDEENSCELLRYNLAENFYTETGVICGELYRSGSEWEFNAIGKGVNVGLWELRREYGEGF
ncbi:MAG: TerD family protein [Synergistaceae bacterium]|nr:TerD family protein [Synergistaceae bacterium]